MMASCNVTAFILYVSGLYVKHVTSGTNQIHMQHGTGSAGLGKSWPSGLERTPVRTADLVPVPSDRVRVSDGH